MGEPPRSRRGSAFVPSKSEKACRDLHPPHRPAIHPDTPTEDLRYFVHTGAGESVLHNFSGRLAARTLDMSNP